VTYQYIGSHIAITDEVRQALARGAPVAFGVSGGKDGSAAASATVRALDELGHTGPRLLIHSDLGRTEWRASLPTCEALAELLGLELVTVRRQAGDMLDRWLTRWANNVERYAALSCVKLILPWSTASMRFCTSELKTAVICRELVRRLPGQQILSVTGIRRQESPKRAKSPVSRPQKRLDSTTHQTSGLDWMPILDWQVSDVWAEHERSNLPVHPAYTVWGASRVSCAFCILSARDDLTKAAACPENAELYRAQVDLELASTFSFQDRQWLADVAPELLTEAQRTALPAAKARAARRVEAEAAIPPHLEYTEGWPTCMPTWSEAGLLADVRRVVADAVGLAVECMTAETVQARYEALMRAKAERGVSSRPRLMQGALEGLWTA
jgi:3'-phosphoadenosine 5'-phosphosulfate sulfotransferase (PAPS reductase)/FAD synthetase